MCPLITGIVGAKAPSYLGSFADEQLAGLLANADPTLDQIKSTLEELRTNLASVRSSLTTVGGGLSAELKSYLLSQASTISNICQQVHTNLYGFITNMDYSVASPFAEYPQDQWMSRMRTQLHVRFHASVIPSGLSSIFKSRLYELDDSFRQGFDSIFASVNEIIRQGIAQSLAQVDKTINEFLGPVAACMGAGQIDGYAHIYHDSLRLLRLDGKLRLKVPDSMEFKGYLQISELTSDGSKSCNGSRGGKTTEALLGANDIQLDWISQGLRANINGKFSFLTPPGGSTTLDGLAGGFEMTGPLKFQGFKITQLGAVLAFGADEAYLGALARVKMEEYEFAGGIFLGRTCDLAPLRLVDPDVASVLPAIPPSLTGGYVYAEGWFPLNEALGIPSSCFLNLRAGIGAGAFFFMSGSVPTYGGKMMVGTSGEVLCIVTVEGKVMLVGVKSGDDLTFRGSGRLSGKAGWCPFCVRFSKSLGLTYKQSHWKVEF